MGQSKKILREAIKYVETTQVPNHAISRDLNCASQGVADAFLPALGPAPRFHDNPAWPGILWLMGFPAPLLVATLFSPTGLSYFTALLIWSLLLWLVNDLLKREAYEKNKKHRKWMKLNNERTLISDQFVRDVEQIQESQLRDYEQKLAIDRRVLELEEALKRPQPISECTHQQAEHLAAQWMRYLGETDAKVSQATRDGGIDVESSNFVVEVKHHAIAIGPVPVRALAGVAGAKKKIGAVFSRSGYSKEAIRFAQEANVLAFRYDPEAGTLKGITPLSAYAVQFGISSVLQKEPKN